MRHSEPFSVNPQCDTIGVIVRQNLLKSNHRKMLGKQRKTQSNNDNEQRWKT